MLSPQTREVEAAEPNALLPHQAMTRNFSRPPRRAGSWGNKGPETPGSKTGRSLVASRFPGRMGPPPTQWKRPEPLRKVASRKGTFLPAGCICSGAGLARGYASHAGKAPGPGRRWVLCREPLPRVFVAACKRTFSGTERSCQGFLLGGFFCEWFACRMLCVLPWGEPLTVSASHIKHSHVTSCPPTTLRSAASRRHITSLERIQSTATTDIKSHQLINRNPPAPSLRSPQSPKIYPSVYQKPSLHRFLTSRAQNKEIRTILSCRYPPFLLPF